MTFNQAGDTWKSEFLPAQKPSTRRTASSELRRLRAQFGPLPLAGVTPKEVNAAIKAWGAEGLAPKTVANLVATLGLVRRHSGLRPFRKGTVVLPKDLGPRREARCFTPAQMAAIVAAARGRHAALFAAAAGTGTRAGELFGLRVGDIDLERGLVHVRRSIDTATGLEQSPKSANGYRWMPVDGSLVEILRAHIGGRTDGYVFQSRNGRPLNLGNVLSRALWPILRNLGISKAGMQAFRHGRVSYLVEQQVPMEMIRQWVGHGSDRLVRRYTHHRPEIHRSHLPPSILEVVNAA